MPKIEEQLEAILFANARASIKFACDCLEPYQGHLRAKSSFVDPLGEIMHWHDFGDLEGPGWAANAVGGAMLLYQWSTFTGEEHIKAKALALLDHVLEDGFINSNSGFIYPYYEIAQQRFCLNYVHNDEWLCPGSLGKIGSQMLDFAEILKGDVREPKLIKAAKGLASWLMSHTPLLPNGWVPRRITIDGHSYPFSPTGGPDPIFDHSADGIYLLELYAKLAVLGDEKYKVAAQALGDAFVTAGGWWGSINHDTYDDHENVAYSVSYRILSHYSNYLDRRQWLEFASNEILPALARFQMHENRQGVATRGLLWMEDTWDTAYLWENAEAAHAYLENWVASGDETHKLIGLGILRAITNHHYGDLGFLTEGVDWNNHVSRRHHVHEALYGAINYTEPLLNNLHHVGPTLFYFSQIGYQPPEDLDETASINLVGQLSRKSQPPQSGENGVRYFLRLYYPAIETDERLNQAIEFAIRAGVDGVLLFEASFDMDPALLTMDVLRNRFARLSVVCDRFRSVRVDHKPIEVHINMMITMGHTDAGCGRPENFPYQFMVDEYGNTSRSTACPIDPGFIDRIKEIYRMAAKCNVDAIWVDDDTRLLLHDLPGLTCFCPRHVEAVSQKTGQNWTREKLADIMQAAQEQVDLNLIHLIRKAWFDVQEEGILSLAGVIEKEVHQISPQTRLGLMTVGTSIHSAEGRRTDRLLRVLAGDSRPLIRPGSGFWSDWQLGGLVDKSEDCARQISFLGPDVQPIAEVENHPYTPFTKSDRVLALELALNILSGMPDISLNLLTSMGGTGPIEPEGTNFAEFLSQQRPFLNALAKQWSGCVRRGVGIASIEDEARWVISTKKGQKDWVVSRPWEQLLARLGIPIGRPDQSPHWIAGETACALSRGEWGQFLRDGAVLDPTAAQVLLDIGLAGDFGLEKVIQIDDAVNELFVDHVLNEGRAGWILPVYNHIPYENLFTWEYKSTSCQVLSSWVNVEGHNHGPAVILLESRDGRRIALIPYAIRAVSGVLLNNAHRDQWSAILEWVSNKQISCRVLHGSNLYPFVFMRPEDKSWLIIVANLSADDMPDARVRLGFSARNVERLNSQGTWEPIELFYENELQIDISHFSLAAYRIVTQVSKDS